MAPTSSAPVVRCAIYTRQSVARPGGDPAVASCAIQARLCAELIEARGSLGWVIADQFDDEGESGATTDRPELLRLFDAIESGRVDRVVVYRVDRFSRRFADFVRVLEMLDRCRTGLSVVSGALL